MTIRSIDVSDTDWTVLDEQGNTIYIKPTCEKAICSALAEFVRTGQGSFTIHGPGRRLADWEVREGCVFLPRDYPARPVSTHPDREDAAIARFERTGRWED